MDEQRADEDERPWEQAGSARRDCKPHRGPLLVQLGDLSTALGLFSPCCGMLIPVGLGLGVFAWVLAEYDLSQMRLGCMDAKGKGAAVAAQKTATFGMILNTLFLIFWCVVAYGLNLGGIWWLLFSE